MPHHFELIDPHFILANLSNGNRELISKIEVFDAIPSTNGYLLDHAKNAPSGWVCFADQQTNGRGRYGKHWFSPPGANIYCSLLWRFDMNQQQLSGLSMVVAMIVAAMLRQKSDEKNIKVKWPNDIVFNGKKLGGILLESNSAGMMVIGIGINLFFSEQQHPDLANAIAFNAVTRSPWGRNELMSGLLNALCDSLPVFARYGLKGFLPRWEEFDSLLNSSIVVHTLQKKITGIMRGVNDRAELILEDEKGELHFFHCGEVTVRLT